MGLQFYKRTETCEIKSLKKYNKLWYNSIIKKFNEFKSPEYVCKVYEKTKYDNLTINTLWDEFIENNMLQIVNKNIFNYELKYKWNKNLFEVFVTKKKSKLDDKDYWYSFIFDGTLNYINTILKTFGWELIYYNKDNILFIPIRIKTYGLNYYFIDDNLRDIINEINEKKMNNWLTSLKLLYNYPVNPKNVKLNIYYK